MTDSGLLKRRSDLLVPVLERLTDMILLARKAFNRQKTSFLDEADQIRGRLGQELEAARNAAQVDAGERIHLQNLVSHVEMIKEEISELLEPLRKQIAGGILFSDKAISQTNFLFDHEAGIFRSLEDILVTGNHILVNYVSDKIDDMHRFCTEFATDHEARLIEGLCQPQAAPIFLGILDCVRAVSYHEREIIRLITE
jgi:Na+/phosphate symporter